jgi:hypothetical protein
MHISLQHRGEQVVDFEWYYRVISANKWKQYEMRLFCSSTYSEHSPGGTE